MHACCPSRRACRLGCCPTSQHALHSGNTLSAATLFRPCWSQLLLTPLARTVADDTCARCAVGHPPGVVGAPGDCHRRRPRAHRRVASHHHLRHGCKQAQRRLGCLRTWPPAHCRRERAGGNGRGACTRSSRHAGSGSAAWTRRRQPLSCSAAAGRLPAGLAVLSVCASRRVAACYRHACSGGVSTFSSGSISPRPRPLVMLGRAWRAQCSQTPVHICSACGPPGLVAPAAGGEFWRSLNGF